MSAREQAAAATPALERDQAQERENSVALVFRYQRVGHIETLDAVLALDTERYQRIEGDPDEVAHRTPVPGELVQPIALLVGEEDRRVRVGHHREDIVGKGVQDRRQRIDRVATTDRAGVRRDDPGSEVEARGRRSGSRRTHRTAGRVTCPRVCRP